MREWKGKGKGSEPQIIGWGNHCGVRGKENVRKNVCTFLSICVVWNCE